MKLAIVLLALCFLFLPWSGFTQHAKINKAQKVKAEAKMLPEVGAYVGISTYAGDLTERSFEPLESNISVGLFYRKPFTKRFSLRANAFWGQISGNDARNSVESGLWQRNLRFETDVFEASAQVEYRPFVLESEFYQFSPYAFAGLGAFYFNPKTEVNGVKYSLQAYRTEGVEYSLFQYCIPFGVGMKVAVNNRGSIGGEVGWRKTFTDHLDDVSTNYPTNIAELAEINSTAFMLSYRGGAVDPEAPLVPSPGSGRGNPERKDWYMFFGLTVGFYLGQD